MDDRSVPDLTTLDALDDAELREGYQDGYDGDSEPGHNRSLAYWHGWRNGAVDGGHREKDDEQALIAHLWVKRNREQREDHHG